MTLSHSAATRWVLKALLEKRRVYTGWCELGIAPGIADVIGVSYPWVHEYFLGQRESAIDNYDRLHANWLLDCESMREGGGGTWPEHPDLLQRSASGLPFDVKTGRKKKPQRTRIDILEVKVSLADLRQDLKRSKMLGYQGTATHCSLVLGPEVFPGDRQRAVDECTRYGLPGEWGIERLGKHGRSWDLDNLRRATALREAKPGEILELLLAMSRSAAYRMARYETRTEPEPAVGAE